jgi:hypothetical protein
MDFIEIGWGSMDWISPAQDRDQWRAIMEVEINLQLQSNVGKFLSSGLSRRYQLRGVR